MNAELLLEHYERIAEAPDAIARLRRFVLDLAVRGKLVEQNPNDEPASELLRRIKANVQHEQKRRGRTRNTSASNALEETPFETPLGWTFASLGELVRVLNGRAYKQQELLDKGIPVLRVGNLFTSNHWYYSDLLLDDEKHCETGDLIYAWSASFGPFIWNGPRVIYHYHIWKLPLVSEADLDKHYLYNFLLQKTREIKDAGHGISMVHMTKEKMEKLLVPLPPLFEQQRIVAKIDELMALCDKLEATQADREMRRDRFTLSTLGKLNEPDPETFADDADFALEHLEPLTKQTDQIKKLRQTILNLAVRGKLVKQDPHDELSQTLLGRIATQRQAIATQRSHKLKTAILRELNDEPFILPASWSWCQLDELSWKITDGDHLTPKRESHGHYLLSARNVHNGRIDLSTVDYVGSEEFRRMRARCDPDRNDILISCSGSVGRVAIVDRDESYVLVRSAALVKLAFPSQLARYVALALISSCLQGQMGVRSKAAAQPNLFLGSIRQLVLPLPPLAEQHRIVVKVGELMALCDQLEDSLIEGNQTRTKFLEAVLHEALQPA